MTGDDPRSLATAQAAALLAIGIWLAVAPRRAARRPPLSIVASPTMTTQPSLRESEWFRGAGGELAAGSRAEEGSGRLSGSRSGPSHASLVFRRALERTRAPLYSTAFRRVRCLRSPCAHTLTPRSRLISAHLGSSSAAG